MSTVSELLASIDSMYTNTESTTDKVRYMNMAQDDLTEYFGLIVEDESLDTTAAQDEYTYPTGIEDITQIEYLEIGNSTTPANRYDYTRYVYSYKDSDVRLPYNYHQGYDNTGAKSLIIYPIPNTSGLPIKIRYRKKLTELSPVNLSASPEFDSVFHDILAVYACYMICSTGANPDEIQANRFLQAYLQGKASLNKDHMKKKAKNPNRPRDNRHWHR